MSLKYFLYRSRMPGESAGKYLGRLVRQHRIGGRELIKRAAQTAVSMSEGQIAAALDALIATAKLELKSGNSVEVPGLCTLRPTLQGTFESTDEPFEHGKHAIGLAASVDKRLRKAVTSSARVEKVTWLPHAPNLKQYRDITSGSVDTVITSGGIGQLSGCELSFDRMDTEQGLFIAADELAEPLPVTLLAKATDKEIVFQTPLINPAFSDVYLLLKRRTRPTGPLLTGKSSFLTVESKALTP